ncbi:succinate dehydrogenase [ubiquinone] cytochrome b small subunit, mitochondrial [Adelges cooleyi]|uniref:succinate dehydrogenase [ubiquinone] cytochrome b small subunit, mitochondrial n=1 Tax=Adelges cooleyi TaxID=133065 RepID=UPI00217F3420|nr:succinate dehydrogenase [ubiquinone] cytochrome b small subunit, mitochondrial [Adelges cooleyi]
MLGLKLLRQTNKICVGLAAQKQISFCIMPSCVKNFTAISQSSNKTVTNSLAIAPMFSRCAGTAVAAKSEKNYANMWKAERIVSIALLPLFPAAIMYSSPVIDTLLALSITFHSYWGLEALVVDYLRVPVVGQVANKAGKLTVTFLSIIMLAGFLQLIFNGDGLGNAIVQLWKV